ncbi:16S rRNA (guanine(527)-N(7))-methyltransferase RsmG [Candidatus Hydrogenedentota bacterium]
MKSTLSACECESSSLQTDQLVRFLLFLQDKLKFLRLTASRDMKTIVRDHLADALLLNREILADDAGGLLIDVGSGNGFPVVPCAILNGDVEATAIESRARRAAFLRMAANEVSLSLNVVEQRAETLAQEEIHWGTYNIASARAVTSPERVLDLIFPFIVPGGVFYAQLGREDGRDLVVYEALVRARGGAIDRVVEFGEVAEKQRGIVVAVRKTK